MSWITRPIKQPAPGLTKREAYGHFHFDYRSIDENTLSLFHPMRARRIQFLYEQSGNDAEAIDFGEHAGCAHTHNAVLHALWMYRVTMELGPVLAKDFADAYELTIRPEEKFAERLMDLYNNWVGRVLASDDNNLQKIDMDVIGEALMLGVLQISPDPKYCPEKVVSELDKKRSKIIS